MAKKHHIKSLYYITHVDNLPSILQEGILSHRRIEDQGVQPARIYNVEIVEKRQLFTAPNGNSLWEFANLYFQPRNAMLYQVIHRRHTDIKNIAVVAIKPQVLDTPDSFISTGNAAHSLSRIVPSSPFSSMRKKEEKELIDKELDE